MTPREYVIEHNSFIDNTSLSDSGRRLLMDSARFKYIETLEANTQYVVSYTYKTDEIIYTDGVPSPVYNTNIIGYFPTYEVAEKVATLWLSHPEVTGTTILDTKIEEYSAGLEEFIKEHTNRGGW